MCTVNMYSTVCSIPEIDPCTAILTDLFAYGFVHKSKSRLQYKFEQPCACPHSHRYTLRKTVISSISARLEETNAQNWPGPVFLAISALFILARTVHFSWWSSSDFLFARQLIINQFTLSRPRVLLFTQTRERKETQRILRSKIDTNELLKHNKQTIIAWHTHAYACTYAHTLFVTLSCKYYMFTHSLSLTHTHIYCRQSCSSLLLFALGLHLQHTCRSCYCMFPSKFKIPSYQTSKRGGYFLENCYHNLSVSLMINIMIGWLWLLS